MEPTTIELQTGETKFVGDLSITNTGGGHKILMRSPEETEGDLPFAELLLATPRVVSTQVRVMNPRNGTTGETTTFDVYTITPVAVEWNGESVKLRIAKV